MKLIFFILLCKKCVITESFIFQVDTIYKSKFFGKNRKFELYLLYQLLPYVLIQFLEILLEV